MRRYRRCELELVLTGCDYQFGNGGSGQWGRFAVGPFILSGAAQHLALTTWLMAMLHAK